MLMARQADEFTMNNHRTDNTSIPDNNSQAQDAARTTDMPFTGTPAAFKERCAAFLVVLCNDKDMEKAARYLAPDCVLIHEDHPPVKGPKAFIEVWQKNLMGMPDYHKDIKDMVVEMEARDQGEAQVCFYSQIIGIVVALHLNRRLWQFTALNSWTGGLSIGSNSWKHCT
jgi:hypothetical protein